MTKNRFRFSYLLVAVFTLFWVSFAVFHGMKQHSKKASDLPKIVKRGVLRVCGEEDLFSFYKDENGNNGFHYELAKAFADKYDLELHYFSENDFDKRLKILTTGKCDFISGPLPIIAELRGTLTYTEPIMESYLVLVQRKREFNKGKKPIRDQILLGRKYIAVTHNSPNIHRLHHLANEISDSIYIREFKRCTNKVLIDGLSKGLVDYVACDRYVAQSYLKTNPEIDIKTNLGLTQYQAWAVRPSKNTLLDSLNQFISVYKKSPAFARLLQKYSEN